jgi:putative ABC transport system permease protein
MQILPILSTLRRHRTAATLIVVQVALTCAIICNAVFLISQRLQRMDRDTGIAEEEILRISLTGIGKDANPSALTREDLGALAAIPGVRAAATVNHIPLGRSSWNSSINLEPHQMHQTIHAAMFFGTDDLVETLGVRIVAGRDFNPDEYVDFKEDQEAKPGTAIVTRSAADKLFPGKNPLGQKIYMGEEPIRVVGVVERLLRPNDIGGPEQENYSIILPVRIPYTVSGNYILRVDPARRGEILAAGVKVLERGGKTRIILEKQTFDDVRDQFYRQDRAMAWLLVAVSAALLIITALGIVGLASFWVQQRTRQIGIRRALGATRRQILRYFQLENFLLATAGIVLGMGMAYGMNLYLMKHYELARLPALYLPLGAAALWTLGQIAVLGPAKRASAVPPAVATRTV